MFMYLLPKTILKKTDVIRKRFFWQGESTKRKYHLVKWTKITKPKKKGGLGVKDLRKMNCSCSVNGGGRWKRKKESGRKLLERNTKSQEV